MPSEPGSPEPLPDLIEVELSGETTWHLPPLTADLKALTPEEQDRIAEGEPYCFRCGRPASSFPEYRNFTDVEAVAYVRQEEGTYNPETNRFACDGCYIAIGMPSGPNGWMAP